MSFLSKVELKKQLQDMGIKVEGEYVRKKDINKILGTSSCWWELKFEVENDDEEQNMVDTLSHIFGLVKQGYTSGHHPKWTIDKK